MLAHILPHLHVHAQEAVLFVAGVLFVATVLLLISREGS